ncbi:MAG: hypothetical protein KC713_07045, partial [Candidatus Omnitrophica bacterium]|nr:hypothetical protein [Candidatus Omnitrophota bacterium]
MSKKITHTIFTLWIVSCILIQQICGSSGTTIAYAQSLISPQPLPAQLITLTPAMTPVVLKGVKIDPENIFQYEFLVDVGTKKKTETLVQKEINKVVKYFLASLTVPDEDLWVNLSPHEKDQIIPDEFSKTLMGRDMLVQDYILKQMMASLTYPDDATGKKFWERVYQRAFQRFGTTDIPVETSHKVWIVPSKAEVFEQTDRAFVLDSYLKVLMEEEYLATKIQTNNIHSDMSDKVVRRNEATRLSREVMKEIVIPELEREVNEGEHFAPLRQIFQSMILATWFKRNLQDNLLADHFVAKNKILGVDSEDVFAKQRIYEQYLQAFRQGVYDFIQEEYDPKTQEIIPRKYFSGGMKIGAVLPQVYQGYQHYSDQNRIYYDTMLKSNRLKSSLINFVPMTDESPKPPGLKITQKPFDDQKDAEIFSDTAIFKSRVQMVELLGFNANNPTHQIIVNRLLSLDGFSNDGRKLIDFGRNDLSAVGLPVVVTEIKQDWHRMYEFIKNGFYANFEEWFLENYEKAYRESFDTDQIDADVEHAIRVFLLQYFMRCENERIKQLKKTNPRFGFKYYEDLSPTEVVVIHENIYRAISDMNNRTEYKFLPRIFGFLQYIGQYSGDELILLMLQMMQGGKGAHNEDYVSGQASMILAKNLPVMPVDGNVSLQSLIQELLVDHSHLYDREDIITVFTMGRDLTILKILTKFISEKSLDQHQIHLFNEIKLKMYNYPGLVIRRDDRSLIRNTNYSGAREENVVDRILSLKEELEAMDGDSIKLRVYGGSDGYVAAKAYQRISQIIRKPMTFEISDLVTSMLIIEDQQNEVAGVFYDFPSKKGFSNGLIQIKYQGKIFNEEDVLKRWSVSKIQELEFLQGLFGAYENFQKKRTNQEPQRFEITPISLFHDEVLRLNQGDKNLSLAQRDLFDKVTPEERAHLNIIQNVFYKEYYSVPDMIQLLQITGLNTLEGGYILITNQPHLKELNYLIYQRKGEKLVRVSNSVNQEKKMGIVLEKESEPAPDELIDKTGYLNIMKREGRTQADQLFEVQKDEWKPRQSLTFADIFRE